MFPHQFGRFLPLVGHLPSEKSILLDFSSSRVVAVSVPFPEVRIRKGTESGLYMTWPDQPTWPNHLAYNYVRAVLQYLRCLKHVFFYLIVDAVWVSLCDHINLGKKILWFSKNFSLYVNVFSGLRDAPQRGKFPLSHTFCFGERP